MSKLKKPSPNKIDLATAIMVVGTLYKIGSGIANNKKRKDSLERAAELDAQLETQMQAMRDYDFRVQNPYEDIDVTTKAQEVAANQQTQQAADILANLAPVAGAGATAALATSIAKQGSAAAAKLQGRMAQQEFQLQQRAAGAQLTIDRGVKLQEFNRDAALMNMQMYRAAGEYAQAAQYGQAAQQDFSDAMEIGTQAAEGFDDRVTKTTTTGEEEVNTDAQSIFSNPTGETRVDENFIDQGGNIWQGDEIVGYQDYVAGGSTGQGEELISMNDQNQNYMIGTGSLYNDIPDFDQLFSMG